MTSDSEGRSIEYPVLLVAVVAFGFAVRPSVPSSIASVFVGVVGLVWAFAVRSRRRERSGPNQTIGSRTWEMVLAFSVVIYGAVAATSRWVTGIGTDVPGIDNVSALVFTGLAIAAYIFRPRASKAVAITLSAVVVLMTLVSGVIHIMAAEGVGLDVLYLHQEAAGALGRGENPYTDAVSVPNGAFTAEPGDTIDGYPYPPVTAVTYSVSVWLFGDARYTSLVAWLFVLMLMGFGAVRHHRSGGIYLLLLLAALPGWPLVLRGAWTEPLSLAFLAAAYFGWSRSRRSGIALGLGLASKQYFVVTTPLLLLHRDDGWRRRAAFGFSTAAATILVAFAWDASAFWTAAIEFHLATPKRADSANLVGLLDTLGVSWAPPLLLTLLAPLGVALVTGRASTNRTGLCLAMTLTLATLFLVSSQAIANYWFLITGLGALSLFFMESDRPRAIDAGLSH